MDLLFLNWIGGGLCEIPQDAKMLLLVANLVEQSTFSCIVVFLFTLSIQVIFPPSCIL